MIEAYHIHLHILHGPQHSLPVQLCATTLSQHVHAQLGAAQVKHPEWEKILPRRNWCEVGPYPDEDSDDSRSHGALVRPHPAPFSGTPLRLQGSVCGEQAGIRMAGVMAQHVGNAAPGSGDLQSLMRAGRCLRCGWRTRTSSRSLLRPFQPLCHHTYGSGLVSSCMTFVWHGLMLAWHGGR